MIKKSIVFVFLLITSYSYSFEPKMGNSIAIDAPLAGENRLELMKEDMLLKFLALYTLEYHIALALQNKIKNKSDAISQQQKAIIVGMIIKMREKDFLVNLVDNNDCFEYAYCYKKQVAPTHEISAQDQAYGSIVAQCFDIIITHSKDLKQAHSWSLRIMRADPYIDYELEEKDISDFIANAPIQEHMKPFWQSMWTK